MEASKRIKYLVDGKGFPSVAAIVRYAKEKWGLEWKAAYLNYHINSYKGEHVTLNGHDIVSVSTYERELQKEQERQIAERKQILSEKYGLTRIEDSLSETNSELAALRLQLEELTKMLAFIGVEHFKMPKPKDYEPDCMTYWGCDEFIGCEECDENFCIFRDGEDGHHQEIYEHDKDEIPY